MFGIFFSGIIRHDVDEKKYLALAKQKQFDCVGQIFSDTTQKGSCVLISDRYVLTAAHVLIDVETRPDTVKMDNGYTVIYYKVVKEEVTSTTGLFVIFKGDKIKVKKIFLHPNYTKPSAKGTSDIAVLELEQPVKKILPAKLNSSFDELNANVVGVGYGASGMADKPETITFLHKKIAGENVIDSLSGVEYLGHKSHLMCDFDHPIRTDCNRMGSATPKPLEYICSGGDSGGGLFRQNGKKWELVGICASAEAGMERIMKTGYYGLTMEWTRVSVYSAWISQQTK
jgi:secreted trypsin-like serine protease